MNNQYVYTGKQLISGYQNDRYYSYWQEYKLSEITDLYMGDLEEPNDNYYPNHLVLNEVEYTFHSDYSGDTVECANCKAIAEDYSDLLGKIIWRVYGGYSTEGIVYSSKIHNVSWSKLDNPVATRIQEFLDMLESLNDYPLVNEEYLSELELKIDEDSWKDYLLYDLKTALVNQEIYTQDEIENKPEENLKSEFYRAVEKSNSCFECESRSSGFWDLERIIAKWIKPSENDIHYNNPNQMKLF